MNDDQLLTRLRRDLDEFVGEPGPAPDLDTMAVTPARSGRSTWVMLGAAAATVAVVVGGLLVLTHDDVEAPLATVAPPRLAEPMPVPPTPEGWSVIEWGDVRLSLPPDLEPYGPGCTSEADDDITVVITCAARVVTVVTRLAGGLDPDRPITVRNGLSTQLVPTPDLEESSSQLLIGETTSLVRLRGFTADEATAIADTVGVSSFWRIGREQRLAGTRRLADDRSPRPLVPGPAGLVGHGDGPRRVRSGRLWVRRCHAGGVDRARFDGPLDARLHVRQRVGGRDRRCAGAAAGRRSGPARQPVRLGGHRLPGPAAGGPDRPRR